MIEPHPVIVRIERRARLMAWGLPALTFVPALPLIVAALWSLL